MPLRDFSERYIRLGGQPISFAGRPYLEAVYGATGRNLALRCSRQVEKTTLLCNRILYEAATQPGVQMLFVTPRLEQAHVFAHTRLRPAIEQSPILRRILMGNSRRRLAVMNAEFANGSRLFIRAAFHSGDAARGVSANMIFLDEFQDIAAGDLPVLAETFSHAANGHMVITGTPKHVDNHLDNVFRRSTACEWQVGCHACQRSVILDERVLGATGAICPRCAGPIDPKVGQWVPRNPDSRWGHGFCINHLMVPWLAMDEILLRQASYDPARFRNEVLGLPTELGDHIITREEIEACCRAHSMAQTDQDVPVQHRSRLFAGIDWGGGGVSATVLVIGYIEDDKHFTIVRLERFVPSEDPHIIVQTIAERCRQFAIRVIAADGGGNGTVYNRLLLGAVGESAALYAIHYADSDQQPRQDGRLWRWTVNRSLSIGNVFAGIKKQLLLFPHVNQCGSFLDEFTCELAVYDNYARTIRYEHPDTQPDDCLHATNYAQLIALRSLMNPLLSNFV